MTELPESINNLRTKLSTAAVGDVLDSMGYRRQFLPPTIKPMKPTTRILGRAMPVRVAERTAPTKSHETRHGAAGPLADQPFGLLPEAVDNLKDGDIYIATGPAQGSPPFALWGGLMSTRAKYLKAAGAIVNGFARDADEIEALGFPYCSCGLYAQDMGARGQVVDYDCSIEIGNVTISPGDLVLGDKEGVLVIPREAEHEAVVRALEKVAVEGDFAKAVKAGMSIREAFTKFGVL